MHVQYSHGKCLFNHNGCSIDSCTLEVTVHQDSVLCQFHFVDLDIPFVILIIAVVFLVLFVRFAGRLYYLFHINKLYNRYMSTLYVGFHLIIHQYKLQVSQESNITFYIEFFKLQSSYIFFSFRTINELTNEVHSSKRYVNSVYNQFCHVTLLFCTNIFGET